MLIVSLSRVELLIRGVLQEREILDVRLGEIEALLKKAQ